MPARATRSGRPTPARVVPVRVLSRVAASVDASPLLVPCFDQLFAGLEALGGDPTRVVRALRALGLGPRARVLDLACGKGATAIALARGVGCRVVGVDACEAFVLHARARAARLGLSRRCRFVLGDVEDASVVPRGTYDCAMMLGLFPVGRAARMLRERAARGGLYVIDDCFRALDAADRDYGAIPTLDAHARAIERLGDRVERVDIPTPRACRALDTRIFRILSRNADRVRARHPDLAVALDAFVRAQRDAIDVLSGPIRPAVWYVRRG
jgi:SAM-dependent methyltransferase